jgi:hypothetical protein
MGLAWTLAEHQRRVFVQHHVGLQFFAFDGALDAPVLSLNQTKY